MHKEKTSYKVTIISFYVKEQSEPEIALKLQKLWKLMKKIRTNLKIWSHYFGPFDVNHPFKHSKTNLQTEQAHCKRSASALSWIFFLSSIHSINLPHVSLYNYLNLISSFISSLLLSNPAANRHKTPSEPQQRSWWTTSQCHIDKQDRRTDGSWSESLQTFSDALKSCPHTEMLLLVASDFCFDVCNNLKTTQGMSTLFLYLDLFGFYNFMYLKRALKLFIFIFPPNTVIWFDHNSTSYFFYFYFYLTQTFVWSWIIFSL